MFSKPYRKIAEIITPAKPAIISKQIFGFFAIIISYSLFLFEIVEFVGYNALRVVFSIVAVSNFFILMLIIFQNYCQRIFGIAVYLLLLWSNVLHFRYFGSTIQIGSLLNFGFLPFLGSQIQLLLHWTDSIYLLAFIASAVFFLDSGKLSIKNRIPPIILFTTVWLGLQIFQYFAETQNPLRSSRKYNESYTRWDIYREIRFESRDHSGSILQFGFLWTYGTDIYRLNKIANQQKTIPEENFLVDIPEENRRNIIVIQVESLDKNIIHHKIDGNLVMPFLSRLTEETLYFPNIYAQHTGLGGTSDIEFCMLTSQYPLGFKGPFFANGLGKLPSIPVILNRNDYVTLAFHGNSGSYFSRKQGLLKLGFQQTFFKDDFVIKDPDRWHAIKDKDFFKQLAGKLMNISVPFFAYIITLTSHTPYDLIDETDHNSHFDVGNPLVNNYLNSMAYVDAALEEFLPVMLEYDPNALIIIYGDHCADINEPEYQSYSIKGLEPVSMIILDQGNQIKKEIHSTGSTIDISPTIFHYMGFGLPPFWQGKSLLIDKNSKNTFIYNSKYYFDSDGELEKLLENKVNAEEMYRIQKYIW